MIILVKAVWKDVLIAESNDTIVIEGNHYFPPDSVKTEYFVPSDTTSRCPWKGLATYYSLNVNGSENKDAAWTYPEPKPAAKEIKGYFAFWKGVDIIE